MTTPQPGSKKATITLDTAGSSDEYPVYQLSINAMDGEHSGHGYRLMGPKYVGTSRTLRTVELTQRDADEIRAIIDAVFPPTPAVLPATTDQTAEIHRLRAEWEAERRELNDMIRSSNTAAVEARADRAAVLRGAADALGRMDYDADSNDYGYDTYRDAWNGGVMDGAAELRRMADETPAGEAREPLYSWRVETFEDFTSQWTRGCHYPNRVAAIKCYETANDNAPLWEDGTPIRRRVVREVTTYTVDVDTAVEARQDRA